MSEYKGRCHCGRVQWEYRVEPEHLTDCNCSICSRLAALWGQCDIPDITVSGEENTLVYLWGTKAVAFHTCKHCGCTTHWRSQNPEEFNRMSVNFRMCEAKDREHLRIRKFDGADTWEFLD